jgi:hypothetical protein
MAPTLKERYNQRQVQVLLERAKAADAQLLQEQRAARLLVEAMDQEDLNKVSAIIDKLNTVKSPELPVLSAAIEQAQAELNKYTGGGPITQAWTKLKSKFGVDNPVVKITTFADALERGFSQIPQILKNNGVDLAKADLSKSLSSLLTTQFTGAQGGEGGMKGDVTGTAGNKEKNVMPGPEKQPTGAKSDTQLGNTSFGGKGGEEKYEVPGPEGTKPSAPRQPPQPKKTGGQDTPPKPAPGKKPLPPQKGSSPGFSKSQEDWFNKGQAEGHELDEAPKKITGEEKIKNIVAQIRKALAPSGFFGAFKKVPYLDGEALAKELTQAPIKVFANVAKKMQSGVKAAEVAPDMKDQITGQGQAQTSHAEPAEPAKHTGQAQPGQAPKPGVTTNDTTPAGQQPPAGTDQTRGGGAEVKGEEKIDHKAVRGRVARMMKNLDPETFVQTLVKAGLDIKKLPAEQKNAA